MQRKKAAAFQAWLSLTLQKSTLAKEDIKQILDYQLSLSAVKMDTTLIEECVLYLHPEYDEGDSLKERARESIARILNLADNSEARKESKKRTPVHRRPAVIAALILLGIMLVGTAVAYTLGYPIWNYVFHWGEEQLHINIEMQAPESSPVSSPMNEYFGLGRGDEFDEKLKELEMNPTLPMLPTAYQLIAVDSSTGVSTKNVIGLYEAQEKLLHVSIQMVSSGGLLDEYVEKDGNAYETIQINGTSYSFFNNLDTSEVIWLSPPYVVQIGGNITKDELKDYISTMNGGNLI